MNHEGALIAFTLLGQLVAGSTILYAILHFTRSDEVSRFPAGFRIKTPELLLLILLLVAMAISFLHLGSARKAVHALNNPGSSWISREIFSLSLLSLSLILLFLGRWLMPARRGIHSVLFLISLGSGASLIYVMIRLYMIPAVVSWNTWYTPSSFIFSSFILGISAFIVYAASIQWREYPLKLLLQMLFVLLLTEALISAGNQYLLDHLSLIHYNPFLLENSHLNVTIIRIALIVVVLFLLAFLQRRSTVHTEGSLKKILTGSVILLVLIEQIAGRWLFFASFVKVGI